MPKLKLGAAKLRKLIHRGTDSALLDSRQKPENSYRPSSTSSPTSDNSPRPSRESSIRRRSSFNTVEDNLLLPGGCPRRITVGSIYPSLTSLEASSHYSASLNSLNSGYDAGSDHQSLHDRNCMIDVTRDVQHILAAVSNLKKALNMERSTVADDYVRENFEEHQHDMTRKYLVDLMHVVKCILAHNQGMKSTAVTRASRDLREAFDGMENGQEGWKVKCNTALDRLTDTFTTSLRDYMQGDCEDCSERESSGQPQKSRTGGTYNPGSLPNLVKGFSRSHDNLMAPQFYDGSKQEVPGEFVDKLDHAMLTRADAINLAMANCKHRSKYLRTVTHYLSKRAQIEADYYRQLDKLGRHTKDALRHLNEATESSMPLLELFSESVEADMHYGKISDTTFNMQVGHKLTEPLSRKNRSNEVKRKELKDNWSREHKKLADAKAALNASRQKYIMLSHEIVKARLSIQEGPPHKLEKKRKELSDLEAKFAEAEQLYRRLVDDTNACQYQVHTAQKSILCALRRLIIETDQIVMMGFQNYFNIQHNFFKQFPEVRRALAEQTQDFEAGREFYKFVQGHMEGPAQPRDFYFEEINLEDMVTEASQPTRNMRVVPATSGEVSSSSSTPIIHVEPTSNGPLENGIGNITPDSDGSSINLSPYHASPRNDTHKESTDYSPLHQPRNARNKKPRPASFYGNTSKQKEESFWKDAISNLTSQKASGVAASVGDIRVAHTPSGSRMTKSAKSHKFHKLETPSRCKECDTQVYFDGMECEVCGLVAHQRCLETLAINCGSKLMKGKLSIFGVDFHKHLDVTHRNIPVIVCKCISEIEQRALDVQGIYRLSGAKKKLERLSQLFETAADRLDLTEQNPHLVASLLKMYLRRLPEPLMTFELYKDFMSIASESLQVLPLKEGASPEVQREADELLQKLKGTLSLLPPENYLTLLCLIYHLKRVASHNADNLMPESNLSIVFGPNLLKSKEPQSSLTALADMTYQAKLVEILIYHSSDLFTATKEEVWGNVNREEIEVVKEMYIPMELSERCHQMDEMDESDEDVDTPPNTPPERRLSNLDDLTAILLTINGEDDVGTHVHEGMGPGNNLSREYLNVSGRGSGRKSALSLQRILTPVGEELASTQSVTTNISQSDSHNLDSEVVEMDVSEYDSDSYEGQSCDGSLFSVPYSDLGEPSVPTSTMSLPVLQNSKYTSSPDIFAESEYLGGLDRKERLRNARKRDRMTKKQFDVAGDYNDSTLVREPTSGEEKDNISPKPLLEPLQISHSEDEEGPPRGLSSPVRADFLSSSASVDTTPDRKVVANQDGEMSFCDQQEQVEQDHSVSDSALLPPISPLDVEGDFFKRGDKSRIGVRHSYPSRPKHVSDPHWRWTTPQGNESSVSPANLADYIPDHPRGEVEPKSNLDNLSENQGDGDHIGHLSTRNPSESCEKDSLSEQSVISILQLVTPDSGNESTHTGDIRGSSSEGDLLEAERNKPQPIPNDREGEDDGIGVSPYMKKEEFFQHQSLEWEGSSDNSDKTHTLSEAKDSILSDDIDQSTLKRIDTSRSLPTDCVVSTTDEDQTSTECEHSDDNHEKDVEVTSNGSPKKEEAILDQNIESGSGIKCSESLDQVKQLPPPTITWRSLGSQSQSLQRADLFEDAFATEGKLSYGSFQPKFHKISSSTSLVTESVNANKKRQRASSEADLLVDKLKAMGAQTVTERIQQWREREVKAFRQDEGSSHRRKRQMRQRKVQSCYDIDLSDPPDFITLSQPTSREHHSQPTDFGDTLITPSNVTASSTEEDKDMNFKQFLQKLKMPDSQNQSFAQDQTLHSENASD